MDSPKLACVTGASGFLGGKMVKMLSKRGYNVRGTVRSLKKHYTYLSSLPNVELFEADLLTEGSFDKPFEDVDVIFHTAAVVKFVAEDPERDIVEPAVKGIGNVFGSALKMKVPYFVMTSSCAAVREDKGILNEMNWNGTTDPIKTPYPHAKVESEKILWKLADENKRKIKVAAICPALILGPYSGTNETQLCPNLVKSLVDGRWLESGARIAGISTCDIRDVCMTHILAYEKDRPERFVISSVISSGALEWSEMLKEKYPNLKYPTKYQENPILKTERFDHSKVVELLGSELIPVKKSLQDMVGYFFEVGILK